MTLIENTESVYRTLSDDRLDKLGLFRIENHPIKTALADDMLTLFASRSQRADNFLDQPVIEKLIAAIESGNNFKGINHVGFCYKVDSKNREVERLTEEAGSKGLHAYQEPSNDDAAWVFVGDISELTNPMLEFLPVEEPISDKWSDYWLPHIQFDIDTTLSPNQIKDIVQKLIDRPFTPHPIVIDGVTCIQRVNLGCVEGVNMMLDIATNNRDLSYRNSWDKLV